MNPDPIDPGPARGPLVRRLVSAPLYVKILGIGGLLTMLYGGSVYIQIERVVRPVFDQLLEQRTFSVAHTLVHNFRLLVSRGDAGLIRDNIEQARAFVPDLEYLVVHDEGGRVLAHSFTGEVPGDLAAAVPLAELKKLRITTRGTLRVFETTLPVHAGALDTVRLGLSDGAIQHQVAELTRTVLLGLSLAMSLGLTLLFLLAQVMTRPITELVAAVHHIGQGDFETRARVHSGDEIGQLASAFNWMAGRLQELQAERQERELERVKLVERTVQVLEDERRVIAQELHDHLGQSLLTLLLKVQTSGHCGSAAKCADISVPFQSDLAGRIRELIDDVRRLAWGIRPSILDDYGLEIALERYVQEVAAQSHIQIDYESSAPPDAPRLPGPIEVTLYRISQEAITNMVRHSGAEQASLVLIRTRDEVTLLIEDRGCGFDPVGIRERHRPCLGLAGMRERMSLLGGTFTLESAPGSGTTIRVRVPFQERTS